MEAGGRRERRDAHDNQHENVIDKLHGRGEECALDISPEIELLMRWGVPDCDEGEMDAFRFFDIGVRACSKNIAVSVATIGHGEALQVCSRCHWAMRYVLF